MKTLAPLVAAVLGAALVACDGRDTSQLARRPEEARPHIRRLFADWQRQQVAARRYWARDSCRAAWFQTHDFDGTLDQLLGFPDSSEVQFSFADLNRDGRLDGLAMFTPEQCDGGNGSAGLRVEVLLLSQKAAYAVSDTLALEKFARPAADSLGFYQLDSLGPNRLYGHYRDYGAEGPSCCPPVNRPVVFDSARRRLIYTGPNQPAQ